MLLIDEREGGRSATNLHRFCKRLKGKKRKFFFASHFHSTEKISLFISWGTSFALLTSLIAKGVHYETKLLQHADYAFELRFEKKMIRLPFVIERKEVKGTTNDTTNVREPRVHDVISRPFGVV